MVAGGPLPRAPLPCRRRGSPTETGRRQMERDVAEGERAIVRWEKHGLKRRVGARVATRPRPATRRPSISYGPFGSAIGLTRSHSPRLHLGLPAAPGFGLAARIRIGRRPAHRPSVTVAGGDLVPHRARRWSGPIRGRPWLAVGVVERRLAIGSTPENQLPGIPSPHRSHRLGMHEAASQFDWAHSRMYGTFQSTRGRAGPSGRRRPTMTW